MSRVPKTGVYVIFADHNKPIKIKDESDREMNRARKEAERCRGIKLPNSWLTGFPEFTLYRNGQEVGGG